MCVDSLSEQHFRECLCLCRGFESLGVRIKFPRMLLGLISPTAALNDDGNEGNFRACLRYRLQGGDEFLRWHLSTCAKNSSFISWNMQNQIISATGELMRNELVKDINAAPFFTLISDATTDSSVKEQMSIVIRYVKNNVIYESFLGFEEICSTTGESIASALLQCLKDHGIQVEKLRGLAFDGCSAMKGENNGVKAVIQRQYPRAHYMHCANYVLNPVVAYAAK